MHPCLYTRSIFNYYVGWKYYYFESKQIKYTPLNLKVCILPRIIQHHFAWIIFVIGKGYGHPKKEKWNTPTTIISINEWDDKYNTDSFYIPLDFGRASNLSTKWHFTFFSKKLNKYKSDSQFHNFMADWALLFIQYHINN